VSSKRVMGVVGSGTMGAGISQAAATAGYVVRTLDLRPELVERAHAKIAERLDAAVAKGKMSRHEREEIVGRLHLARSYDDFKDAECVIEAAQEDLAVKRRVFADLDKVLSAKALRCTNTSSLSIARIGEGLGHADRFLGMHFFNPAPVMKLVELVQGPATGDQAMVDARAVCAFLDKTPVRVKDSPGFIGNRVNRPFYLEALHLLENGEADVRAIDTALKSCGGFKMGPFELLDLIGLDINLSVTRSVHDGFGRPTRFAPSSIQEKLVALGHLGRKTNRGFYDYTNGDGGPSPAYEARLKSHISWKPTVALSEFAQALGIAADRNAWLFARILLAVVNEAALTADTIALPRDVDVAMELGFNYPQGPLGLADHVGLDVVQRLMADFHAESGGHERFAPSPLLDRLVAEGDLGEKTAKGFLYHAL
jgi:3-hydroxybutyryl-CoA dehydrogenase